MAVVLALGTSLAYGVANYLGPLLSRRLPFAWVIFIGQSAALVACAVLVLATGVAAPDAGGLAIGLAAGIANAVALLVFYRATQLGDIGITTSIGAIGALVPVAAGLLSGEQPSALQLAGIPLAICGVALAASTRGAAPADRAGRRKGVALALLAALLFGVFLTVFARAAEEGVLWATLDTRISMVGLIAVVLLVTRQRLPVTVRELPPVMVPGLLLVAGTISFAAATTAGLLSVVSVIATLFPVVTVALAVLLLGERLDGRQRLGVAAALAGVCVIVAG